MNCDKRHRKVSKKIKSEKVFTRKDCAYSNTDLYKFQQEVNIKDDMKSMQEIIKEEIRCMKNQDIIKEAILVNES